MIASPLPISDMETLYYTYSRKFAFLPVEFRHGKWAWLKFYHRKYAYIPSLDVNVYVCAMNSEDATADKLKNI